MELQPETSHLTGAPYKGYFDGTVTEGAMDIWWHYSDENSIQASLTFVPFA